MFTKAQPTDHDPSAGSKFSAAWLLVALPAMAQVGLLLYAFVHRFAYPFDLEWMEGGMLEHAQRLGRTGIYVAPTVDFIPYPYPPLYPAVVAAAGALFGISYPLARAISIAAVFATGVLIWTAILRANQRKTAPESGDRALGWGAAMLSIGCFAAGYPWVEGWYDIARVDSLFIALVLAGILGLYQWCCPKPGRAWHFATSAALLATSFFCKQTGVLFVAGGAALVAARHWQRLPMYIAITATIGGGGTALINYATEGWFWTYNVEVMTLHDFNTDRFFGAFRLILAQHPVVSLAIPIALVTSGIARIRTGQPLATMSLLWLWSGMAAVAVLAGALGWAKSWAHFNAFMPALLMLSVAAGVSIVAIARSAEAIFPRRPRTARWLPGLAGAALSVQLGMAWWRPNIFIPTAADAVAGRRLVEIIRSIDGDVWVPFHPWYARLAGKKTYLHRMPALDVSYGQKWPIAGLKQALYNRKFAAVIWDNRGVDAPFADLTRNYERTTLPSDAQPRVFTGAGSPKEVHGASQRLLRPSTIWIPKTADPVEPMRP